MSKVGKSRPCPAVERTISSSECGENRNSKYACPASCEFNPFAPVNYGQFLEMEERFESLAIKRLRSEPAEQRRLDEAVRNLESNNIMALTAFLTWEIFFRTDVQGTTCMERWGKSGMKDLRNDFRVLADWRMRTITVRLLEVQRVLDNEQVETLDLLNSSPLPIIVRDRSLAKAACRYDVMLGFSYDLPFYSRIVASAVHFPDFGAMNSKEALLEILAHLGGPTEPPALPLWLAENFMRIEEAVRESAEARRQAGVAASDLRMGRAVYRLLAPYAECRAALESQEHVFDEPLTKNEASEGFSEARVWLEAPGRRKVFAAETGLGRVLLGQAMWRVEALTEKRLRILQEKFEASMGAKVSLEGVRLDDVFPASKAEFDAALVPPALLENPPIMEVSTSRMRASDLPEEGPERDVAMARAQDELFLEEHVPALKGATPREAARHPELWPLLVRLLKQRINATDRRNLEQGTHYDPRWYIEELGVSGLALEMPPKRTRPVSDEDEERPLAPAVPVGLDPERVAERMDRALSSFSALDDVFDEMVDAGCTWLDDLTDWLPFLTEKELSWTETILARLWFSMVPVGSCVELPSCVERANEYAQRFLAAKGKEPNVDLFLSQKQKSLSGLAVTAFLTIEEEFKTSGSSALEAATGPSNAPIVLLFMAAAVDELHLALEKQNE